MERTVEKSKKQEVISAIKRGFEENEAVFVVNQNKMTVVNTENLRKQLRDANATYLVCKNTLARLAAKDSPFACILPELTGQTAIVFSKNLTETAKVVQEFASKSDGKVTIVCGGYSGKLLSTDDVKTLSQLPSMDELRARIIAVIQTPAQRLSVLAQAPAGQIARVLKAYSEK